MKEIIVKSENGIHARPASRIIALTSGYNGTVSLIKDNKSYNAKSLIDILSMGLIKGTKVGISVEGNDAKVMEEKVVELINQIHE